MDTIRFYICGPTRIETGRDLIDERVIGGPQQRTSLAYLLLQTQPAESHDIAAALWGDHLPPSWESSLSALMANLRSVISACGLERDALRRSGGCYELLLRHGTWVDWRAGVSALDQAEGAMRRQDPREAWGWAGVATAIWRRPLLLGVQSEWVDKVRAGQQQMLIRALDCFTDVCWQLGEPALAARAAAEALEADPFRESGYARLMRLQIDSGNRAEALRTYERCRVLLAEELGVDPSPEVQEVYYRALG